MYSKLKCIGFLCLLLFLRLAHAESPEDRLVNNLSLMRNMRANFVQAVLDGKGNTLQRSSGSMAIQRPGLFRWETSEPTKQLLIANGKKIWFYDVGLQQVTVQKQPAAQNNSPAALLSGEPRTLIKNFQVTQLLKGDSFRLKPKVTQGLFRAVVLNFNHGLLRSMLLIDNLNQKTSIQFSQVQQNVVLSANTFRFVLPRGVDLIRH